MDSGSRVGENSAACGGQLLLLPCSTSHSRSVSNHLLSIECYRWSPHRYFLCIGYARKVQSPCTTGWYDAVGHSASKSGSGTCVCCGTLFGCRALCSMVQQSVHQSFSPILSGMRSYETIPQLDEERLHGADRPQARVKW